MGIRKSGEDYLETILTLRQRNGDVRSVDVAEAMGFSKPSVSVAMKKLRESGYVTVAEDGTLSLTSAGEVVAQRIYHRHQVIVSMLIAVGVEPETAAAEACQIEHVISDDTLEKIREYFR